MSLLRPSNTQEGFISLSLPGIIWCKMKDLFKTDQKNIHKVVFGRKGQL